MRRLRRLDRGRESDVRDRSDSRDAEALLPFARFSYPSDTIVVRPQPPQAMGNLHLISLLPGVRDERWRELLPSRPLRDHAIALAGFSPEEQQMEVLFGDVADQVAFEAVNLGRDEPFLLKSPDGGVWRTRIEQRLEARPLPRNDYAIAARYRLGHIETLSQPRRQQPG